MWNALAYKRGWAPIGIKCVVEIIAILNNAITQQLAFFALINSTHLFLALRYVWYQYVSIRFHRIQRKRQQLAAARNSEPSPEVIEKAKKLRAKVHVHVHVYFLYSCILYIHSI